MKRLTIQQMRKLARKSAGRCLSGSYANNTTKLFWECNKGHRWEATPHDVKGGKWCPFCAGNKKKTIDEMKAMAHSRGGQCLSIMYANTKTKLLWRCGKGHEWEATPHNIKKGTWCPTCSKEKKSKSASV